MAYRQEHRVAEIVQRSGVLDGRIPWHPKQYTGNADVQQQLEKYND
jgi:methylenetetrahydrofolate reductase (NADPH)